MAFSFRRAVAASIPAAVLAGTSLTASAAPFANPNVFRPFVARPFAAGPTVLGGGATLPVPAYLGKSVGGGYESSGQTSFGVVGSIFGYFASQSGGLNVEYCATGSGKGKGVFDGPANTVDTPCSNAANPNATTFGFLPPNGTPRQTYPTLAGTDAPLAQSEYSAYTGNHPAPLEPVELPSVFGSIAIYYHDSNATTRLTLNDAQICGVYNGTITTFGQLRGVADSTIIHPVYRLDGSGTSFNFSNHLATACSGFNGNQTFTLADSRLPATKIGATGNGMMVAAVNANNGAIAYVEAAYLTNSPSGTGPINYANVTNRNTNTAVDPFQGLPAAANSVPSSLTSNAQVIQGGNPGGPTGPATLGPLSGVRFGSCVQVVAPANYANPRTGYPIVAVTYLLANSNGNGSTVESGLRLLERDLTTQTLFKHPGATTPITTVDEAEPAVTAGTTGYSSLGAGFNAVIQSTANSCINV